MQLDEIDLNILEHLQNNARIANVDLADRVGLSPAPCLRRVRALEEGGVIRRYLAVVDQSALNVGVTVFVQVTLDLQVEGRLEIFESAVMNRPEVLECYLMTGDADYLLRVVVPDVPAYERFLRDTLTRIESAAGIKSSFALKQVKYFTGLPLNQFKSPPSVQRPVASSRAKPPDARTRHARTARKRSAARR
jgi:Lrp/AsnC family leucine-responsive transcriptional regulator